MRAMEEISEKIKSIN